MLLFLKGPEFGFDVFSINSNETLNSSLDLAMFGDVGVIHDLIYFCMFQIQILYNFSRFL